ncbi:MAG: hypothetical protein H7A25_20410 [Leptospiraceae bacterium]|nr:hypothetical protein [Leptospiraceae bacterium]
MDIAGATASTYSIAAADYNQYLRYSVTPLDQYGLSGTRVYTTPTFVDANPRVGNSGLITSSAMVDTSTVVLNWTKGTDLVTAQTALTYKVYRSSTNDISTVAEMDAKTPKATLTNANTYTDTGATAGTNFYYNLMIVDGHGNKIAYGGFHRVGVWVGDRSLLPAGWTGDWVVSILPHGNCPIAIEDGSECIRSTTTSNSSLSYTVNLSYPGQLFFVGVGIGGTGTCIFTLSNSSGTTNYDFSLDNMVHTLNLSSGANTFTWKYTGAGGDRCLIDRIRY